MTDLAGTACRLLDCPRTASREVCHPGRPEARTPLCKKHADTVAEELEGVEVATDA